MRKYLGAFSVIVFVLLFWTFQSIGQEGVPYKAIIDEPVLMEVGPFALPLNEQCPQLYYNITKCSGTPWNETEVHSISGDLCSCIQTNLLVDTTNFTSAITVTPVYGLLLGTEWITYSWGMPVTLEPGQCWLIAYRFYNLSGIVLNTYYAAGVEYEGTLYYIYRDYPLTINCP